MSTQNVQSVCEVQQLFCVGKDVFSAKQNRLSDKNFERLLLEQMCCLFYLKRASEGHILGVAMKFEKLASLTLAHCWLRPVFNTQPGPLIDLDLVSHWHEFPGSKWHSVHTIYQNDHWQSQCEELGMSQLPESEKIQRCSHHIESGLSHQEKGVQESFSQMSVGVSLNTDCFLCQ